MSNTTRKGNKLQRKARGILERAGYVCHTAVRTSQRRGGRWFSQSNDVFGAFDILATRLGEPVRYIQVTDIGHARARIAKVDSVPLDLDYCSVEVWGWKGGRRRRHKTTGEWLDRQYFQIYYKSRGWELDSGDRVREEEG